MNDLRALLSFLEKENKLVKVKKEVDLKYELTAAAKLIHKKYKKAVLFENVKNSKVPVISYLYPDREVVAASLNMDFENMIKQWAAREETQVPYKVVEQGPVNEVVDLNPDLFKLPLSTHSDGNAGPYVTGGIVIAKHPDTGVINASFNRCQLIDKNELRVRMMPPQHLGVYFEACEKQDKPLEAAIVIGAPPAVMFSAASKIPDARDELEFAGALSNDPLLVTKCKTIDLLVPANAEIVIEGQVIPHVRAKEGPFGEFTDSYVPEMENHVFKVTAITQRKDPIYHDIFAGGKEDLCLLGLPIEAEIYNHIRKYANFEDIRGIATNSFVFGCVIGLKKQREDQPKNILLSALASYSWIKMAVVVDDDVNIYDAEDVLWAIQTRCRPDRDIIIVPGVSSYTREDVKDENVGKFGIDATAPLHKKHIYKRRKTPLEDQINIDEYIDF